jgi:hypothetical protein
MTILGNKKFCYWIPYFPNGPSSTFVPAIVVANEAGYYETDWNWGADRDLAVQIASDLNLKLGYTEADVESIVLSSMSKGKVNHA